MKRYAGLFLLLFLASSLVAQDLSSDVAGTQERIGLSQLLQEFKNRYEALRIHSESLETELLRAERELNQSKASLGTALTGLNRVSEQLTELELRMGDLQERSRALENLSENLSDGLESYRREVGIYRIVAWGGIGAALVLTTVLIVGR